MKSQQYTVQPYPHFSNSSEGWSSQAATSFLDETEARSPKTKMWIAQYLGNHGYCLDVQVSCKTKSRSKSCIPRELAFTLAVFSLIFLFSLVSNSLLGGLCIDQVNGLLKGTQMVRGATQLSPHRLWHLKLASDMFVELNSFLKSLYTFDITLYFVGI